MGMFSSTMVSSLWRVSSLGSTESSTEDRPNTMFTTKCAVGGSPEEEVEEEVEEVMAAAGAGAVDGAVDEEEDEEDDDEVVGVGARVGAETAG
jgi:hypothetical protein